MAKNSKLPSAKHANPLELIQSSLRDGIARTVAYARRATELIETQG